MSVFWVIEGIACLIENLAGLLFVSDMLGAVIKKYRETALFSVLLTAGLIIINRIKLFTPFATVYGVAGMTACACIIYRKKLRDTVAAVISFFLILYLLDFFFVALIGIFTGDYMYGTWVTIKQSYGRIIYILLTKTSLIILCIIFHRWVKWIGALSGNMLLISAAFLMLMTGLLQRVCMGIDSGIIGLGILFFLLLVMGAWLMVQHSKVEKQKLQAELMEERSRIMADGYRNMLRSYNSRQVYYHDLKNHMLTIERYLRTGEYGKAEEYAASLYGAYRDVSVPFWTGIEIFDFMLSYKKASAKEKGICFEIEAVPAVLSGISENDLCALLGNVLDNAIEGCERAEGEKRIHVSARNVRETFMIKVANTCSGEQEKKEGLPVTTKGDQSLHGWGMRSMEMIMEKYGGTMQYDCKEGEFTVILTFFL